MNLLAAAPIALMVVGLLVWGYGARVDDAPIRLIGILLLGAAVGLRLAARFTRRTGGDDAEQ